MIIIKRKNGVIINPNLILIEEDDEYKGKYAIYCFDNYSQSNWVKLAENLTKSQAEKELNKIYYTYIKKGEDKDE